jgi:SET and RING associated domain
VPHPANNRGMLMSLFSPCFVTRRLKCPAFRPSRALPNSKIIHPTLPNYVIWWPSADPRRDWCNHSLEDGDLMTESHRNFVKNKSHYYGTIKWPHKRIIFYFTRDVLGFLGYRFMGVYEIDFEKSNEQEGLFWKRVNKEFRVGIDI